MKYPHITQHDERDCGAACLSMISRYYGLKLPIARFRSLIKVDNQGANVYGIVTGARSLGMDADGLEGSPDELLEGIQQGEIVFPFIARVLNENKFEHFVVVYQMKNGNVVIGDPGKDRITKMPMEEFFSYWQGQIVIFSPNEKFEKKNECKGTMSRYFRFITRQKKLLAFVFAVSILVSTINLFGSVIFQYVIDDAVVVGDVNGEVMAEEGEHDHDHDYSSESIVEKIEEKLSVVFANINTVCISIIVLYLFRALLQVLRGYLLALTSKKVAIPLTLDFYNHMVDLPTDFFGTRKTGELMSRFQNASEIREAISTTTLTIMLDTIMAVVCGIFLYTISPALFVVTMITMAVYALIIFLFRKPIKNINYNIMEQDAQVTSYLKESLEGMETIKAYQYEEMAKGKTEKLFTKLINQGVKGSVVYTLQDSLVEVAASIGTVILMWVGAFLCVENTITIGMLITFYYLIGYFLEPVQNLINLQPMLQTAVVAAERLNDVLDAPKEENDNKMHVSCGDIAIHHVDFRYGNRNLVLKDITLNIPQGKKVALIGESGCGKTTLAKLLMSFYQPEQGEISIGGKNLSDCSPDSIRKHIAYISQNIFLFSDTIYNNLRMGDESISDERIQEVCKLCQTDEFVENLPMKYETVLDENGNNLSGGQKQRLAIARAMLREPDILIMDEATSNLDTITEEGIKKTLDEICRGKTCIMIAHRLRTIRNCDYIYVMDKGKIAEEGTHEELISKQGMYYQYWEQ
ncbi:MAG: peptidase domain-containing ABC transporter [Lachnospiraceae bacterium]|nr:peptidase domain-containing ABC transporter [Lachnospiraceae bacterium]